MKADDTTKMATDDPPSPHPRENLRMLPNDLVWLFETTEDFASISVDAFARLIPGGSVVICKCADQTRTIILDGNARMETTY